MKEKNEILSRHILSYLTKQPEAGDTLEGIVTWWLEHERIDRLVDEVANVLQLLERKGTIRTHKTPSGLTIYRIKK